jgi:aspartate-semialdehyde dehydrogenase
LPGHARVGTAWADALTACCKMQFNMQTKTPVGILGATGMVGQRFVQLLEHHPWFEVAWLAASDRSEGRSYGDAARWKMRTPMPARVAEMRVSPAVMEPRFASAGCAVVTNSSALRMQSDVPLVIPEVNPDHIQMIECQSWRKKSGGFVVTNPNCSAIGLVMALKPLQDLFGLETVMVVTMQAVSGAGYPGVASLDILGNVIPYISKEEEKMEEETRKLLGSLNGSGFVPAEFGMSAQCNRVAVEDGHTESVSVRLKKKARPEEMIKAWNEFRSVPQELKLPSAPEQPVRYTESADRPQPRFDVESGNGMTATVGRLRPCGVFDWKFTVLSHNTIRGAAGAALLNAELLKVRGYLG